MPSFAATAPTGTAFGHRRAADRHRSCRRRRRPTRRSPGPIELLNPSVAESPAEADQQYEGCLSFFDVRGLVPVPGPLHIVIAHTDIDGAPRLTRFEHGLARLVLYEIDDLDGKLYRTRMRAGVSGVPTFGADPTVLGTLVAGCARCAGRGFGPHHDRLGSAACGTVRARSLSEAWCRTRLQQAFSTHAVRSIGPVRSPRTGGCARHRRRPSAVWSAGCSARGCPLCGTTARWPTSPCDRFRRRSPRATNWELSPTVQAVSGFALQLADAVRRFDRQARHSEPVVRAYWRDDPEIPGGVRADKPSTCLTIG
ncbi:peptide deformylase [Streptomyces sp. NBC_01508]|uniref:peptide deformylase n=1 Tax=Streptomyces sp. NBC_01508 TaxID=2903888 RepID=UPI00386EB01C